MSNRLVLIIALCLFTISCDKSSQSNLNVDEVEKSSKVTLETGLVEVTDKKNSQEVIGEVGYFPKESVSEFEQDWYFSHLEAMREPVLFNRTIYSNYFVFRVLFLPTWGHSVAFRYESLGQTNKFRGVMLTGAGGYSPGEVGLEKKIIITNEEMQTFLFDLENSDYWKLSSNDDVMGLDGSQLVIESILNGEYKILTRWTPSYQAEDRGLENLVKFYTEQIYDSGLCITGGLAQDIGSFCQKMAEIHYQELKK